MEEKKLEFPAGFLWGAATSAHQVEGNNTNCDWWAWEQLHQPSDKQSGLACDHYQRYEQDFDLAKRLEHNAHRLSIEWSRVQPQEGVWSDHEFDHYRRVLQALKDRGLTTLVTLHHFTSPLWLVRKYGGWTNKKAAYLFTQYAQETAKRLNDLIDYYITINEPLVYTAQTYFLGNWPAPYQNQSDSPAKLPSMLVQSIKTYQATQTMIKAHCLAYQAIKKISSKPVGIVKNCAAVEPADPNRRWDRLFTWAWRYLQNQYFLDRIRHATDFIGLNHYFHESISMSKKLIKDIFHPGHPLISRNGNDSKQSDLGWGISPKGIYLTLNDLKKYNKPIIITENGLADSQDANRAEYIYGYLKYVHQAIQEGADIRGYLHWSLIDNFEWAFGFWPRFGLIEVDYKTMERRIRPSAWEYAKICKNNGLILDKMP